MNNEPMIRPAIFSERMLAFAVDAGMFTAGWALTLKAMAPGPMAAPLKGASAALVWGGLFVAYQAFFSSEGRASLGKSLLGLSIVGPDGQPLEFTSAFGRSVGYFFSQIFAAGFLWALVDPAGRALHDIPFASKVIARQPLSAQRLAFVRLGTFFVMAAAVGIAGWRGVWEPRYERLMTVAYARDGLREYSLLQKTYKREHGHYADNMFALAIISADPRGFLRDTAALYDRGRVAIVANRDRFSIAARANDVDKTLVAVSGP